MAACTFFGHRDCPSSISGKLRDEIERLITEEGVDTFYVGTQGDFDRIVYSGLIELRERYRHIKVYRILAYLPTLREVAKNRSALDDTVVPEGIENVHSRYAIVHRNNWMIDRSEYVIAYVNRSFGGACKAVERARKKGRTIISIIR